MPAPAPSSFSEPTAARSTAHASASTRSLQRGFLLVVGGLAALTLGLVPYGQLYVLG